MTICQFLPHFYITSCTSQLIMIQIGANNNKSSIISQVWSGQSEWCVRETVSKVWGHCIENQFGHSNIKIKANSVL